MQIFSPSADTWLRAGLLGIAVLLLAAGLMVAGYVNSGYANQVGWFQDQQVPFSHKHHVGELGLDCRYCHNSVETAANAGLPSTHVCMTCHSQIWTGARMLEPVRRSYADGTPLRWHRVAQLPDYVYFNHSIHIDRGVACVDCHGRVDKMPLTYRAKAFQMKFCLDCHRDPVRHLRPRDQVTRMDWSEWTPQQADRFGKTAMAHFHIRPSRLDNCGICHR
ncbi:cytochrome c3 family protein [Novosphingobium sp. PY1]|uniref:cytochrome c3 family protein n=1 Tax=Novosphingobium sp. PY1 TaxID=1882221 RepID=UPI001AA3988B|nr:cytochrome c3 family protein [Novosphingobium sp. PY1]GFM30694.1 chaperone protein HtpG [Novosphingobium sp. PY1]